MMGVGLTGQIVIGLIAGAVLGAFHFTSLSWNTRLFTSGGAGKAIALQLGRIAVAFGALLCGTLGFLVARPLLLWRFGALR